MRGKKTNNGVSYRDQDLPDDYYKIRLAPESLESKRIAAAMDALKFEGEGAPDPQKVYEHVVSGYDQAWRNGMTPEQVNVCPADYKALLKYGCVCYTRDGTERIRMVGGWLNVVKDERATCMSFISGPNPRMPQPLAPGMTAIGGPGLKSGEAMRTYYDAQAAKAKVQGGYWRTGLAERLAAQQAKVKKIDDYIAEAMSEFGDSWAPVKTEGSRPTNYAEAAAKRTSLLQLIDRQAAMFSEAGPLTVKAERGKLHKLVEEYSALPK